MRGLCLVGLHSTIIIKRIAEDLFFKYSLQFITTTTTTTNDFFMFCHLLLSDAQYVTLSLQDILELVSKLGRFLQAKEQC